MIDTNALKAIWVAKGMTQTQVATDVLHITPKTLSLKLKKGVLGSDEIEALISAFGIKNPIDIFFANKVTQQVTYDLEKKTA